jgi:23S rRNA (pseudouridine1915-N3)-methyltransferase
MIKIICVGKIKEPYLKEGIKEYLKRLSKYTKVEIIELEDINTQNALAEEKNKIMKILNPKDYNIALTIDGEALSSVELSNKISKTLLEKSTITFIIGSSTGLDKEIIDRCDYRLSFSKLTFPHQLFRLILLEQIYRSFKIINNEEYHK